jgi:hypothetical protein
MSAKRARDPYNSDTQFLGMWCCDHGSGSMDSSVAIACKGLKTGFVWLRGRARILALLLEERSKLKQPKRRPDK